MWWDRQRANAPILEKIESEKQKVANLVKALKDYSSSHPELKAIFDNAAI